VADQPSEIADIVALVEAMGALPAYKKSEAEAAI
jgi:hypothetical protein